MSGLKTGNWLTSVGLRGAEAAGNPVECRLWFDVEGVTSPWVDVAGSGTRPEPAATWGCCLASQEGVRWGPDAFALPPK